MVGVLWAVGLHNVKLCLKFVPKAFHYIRALAKPSSQHNVLNESLGVKMAVISKNAFITLVPGFS